MPISLLSLLARVSAGALLFQATAPVGLAAKEAVDASLARRKAEADLRAAALAPPKPMKGVPLMRVIPAVPAPPLAKASGELPPGTYLNDVASRPGGIDPALVAGWRAELARSGVPQGRQAWLQLWVGESRLAREEPDDAEGWLARAARLGKGTAVEGIAAYDLAAARFYEGRYAEAGHEFRALVKSKKRGYERRNVALFLRHTELCGDYHARHEALGVPQPPRLDPLCGVASVAVCLRALGMAYAKGTVLAQVPHHGMGSSLAGGIVLPNGARIGFTGTRPTAASPHTDPEVTSGEPFMLGADYDAASGQPIFTITDGARNVWKTLPARWAADGVRNGYYYPIGTMTDRLGHSLRFNYNSYAGLWNNGASNQTVLRLSSIADANGTTLLSIGMDAHGWIVSANDRYGRSVYYTEVDRSGGAPAGFQTVFRLLSGVSQVVATGTANPPVRYAFEYAGGPTGEANEESPYLGTVSVPSPTGSGMATMTFEYTQDLGYISRVLDAHGRPTTYGARPWYSSTQAAAPPSNPPGGGGGPIGPGTVTPIDDDGGDGNVDPNHPKSTDRPKPMYVTVWDGNVRVRQLGYELAPSMDATKRYDAAGNVMWAAEYAAPNSPHRPSRVTDANNRVWNYTWDHYGHMLSKQTPKGVVTRYTYDYSHFALGELTEVQEGGKTATFIDHNEPSGLASDVSTPVPGEAGTGNVQTTSYLYTAMGNLASVHMPGNGAASTRTTTYGYTTDGAYSQPEAMGEPITVTDELGKVWHTRYDARGNAVQTWDPLGNTTDAVLNLADQTVAELAPATGNTGTGRSSGLTTYLYVGGPATREDAKDESGAVVRTVNATYGLEGETLTRTGSAETVSMAYDGAYAVKTLTDGNGHATTYERDLDGRTTRMAYPGASGASTDQVRYTGYDLVGNLLSRTDGNGQEADYAYDDGDGRLTSVTYPGATASNVSVTYDGYGRATSTQDGAGTAASTYDDGDRALTGTRTYTGLPARTFTYAYWPDGSRKSMVNPAGTWTYAYDAAGRYASMSSPAGTSSATYLDNGWQSSRTLPNGVATSYAYNAIGALTGQLSQTAGAATLSQYGSFAYDGAFNLTGLTASVPGAPTQGGSTTYAYDAKDRLTGESSARLGGYAQSHAYDAAGNPTTLRGAAGTFDADSRRTGTGFAYDGNGSPTTYRGSAMGYDPEARATTLGTLTAGYRSDGLRAWKQSGGSRTYFLYDRGEPVLELDASGAVVATNVHAPDGLVARGTASGWAQYAFDAEGSVAQRLSATGGVLSSSAYDAYGSESSTATPSDPFGYHARDGYYTDAETGLCYCRNRYYDPATGRWVTRDPIGYDGGVNLYGYCAGGPVGSADPSGLSVWGWGDDQWTAFSAWIGGRTTSDSNGKPVHVGGWRRSLNQKGNAETYNGTVHLYDEDDWEKYKRDIHWQDHENQHRNQEGGAAGWVFLSCWGLNAVGAYGVWELRGRPKEGGYYGHDYNPWEIWADNHADFMDVRKTPGHPSHRRPGMPLPGPTGP